MNSNLLYETKQCIDKYSSAIDGKQYPDVIKCNIIGAFGELNRFIRVEIQALPF